MVKIVLFSCEPEAYSLGLKCLLCVYMYVFWVKRRVCGG